MASTFSPSLKLELIGNGDQSGTWGTTTNTNLGTLLEQAITGVQAITMLNADYTLVSLNGASDEPRNAVLVVGGTNSAIRNLIAPAVEKIYVIKNATSGGFAIVIKTSASTGVSIPNGATVTVYCDGSEFYLSVPASSTANAPDTLALRNGSGNFSANIITAALTGDVTGVTTGAHRGTVGATATLAASALVENNQYTIATVGSTPTNWVAIGAADANVGTVFTKNSTVATGNGTATTNPTTGAFTTVSASGGVTGNLTGNVTGNLISVTNTINAGSFIVGNTYVIASLGSPTATDFTLIGAASNTVGVRFTATGVGAGNGTATTFTGRAVNVTGVVAVENGGTGSTSFTQNAVIVGNGTGVPTAVLPSTNGNLLTATAGATVAAASLVEGTQYTILTVGATPTNWTSIGAAAATVGTVFIKNSTAATGDGTATTNVWASAAPPTVYPLTSGTAVTTTSGLTADFTGIPSWVKRVTLMVREISFVSSGNFPVIKLGTSAGLVTSGYTGAAMFGTTGGTAGVAQGLNFAIYDNSPSSSDRNNGTITFTLLDSNTWTMSGNVCNSNSLQISWMAGSVVLPGVLDRIQVAASSGAAFDSGIINILYE
jgi:hypothetical protein